MEKLENNGKLRVDNGKLSTNHSQFSIKTPEVRFPEFKDEWEVKKLGEVLDYEQPTKYIVKSSDYNQNFKTPVLTAGKTFILGYSDEIEGIYENYPVIIFDDFTMANQFVDFPFKVKSSAMKILKNDSSKTNLIFIYSAIQTIKYPKGNEHKRFWISEYSKIKLPFPTLPEQQKIAHFFSIVDQKLTQLQEKKTALELYKKGMMQQLFNGEWKMKNGKRKFVPPTVRFKPDDLMEDGELKMENEIINSQLSTINYPDWEVKKLGEVISKKSSNISANKIENNFGDYIIYGASGVLQKVDFYREENEYISIIKDGAGVGRVSLCKPQTSVLGTLDILKTTNNNLRFMFFFMETFNFLKFVTGSTIPHIYFSDYKNAKIQLPSIKEQTKIANFLSKIDDKINAVNAQIETTKIYKKGLLQSMFVN